MRRAAEAAACPAMEAAPLDPVPALPPALKTPVSKTNDPADGHQRTERRTAATARPLHLQDRAWRRSANSGPPAATPIRPAPPARGARYRQAEPLSSPPSPAQWAGTAGVPTPSPAEFPQQEGSRR